MHPASDYFPAKPHKGRGCVRICFPEDPQGAASPWCSARCCRESRRTRKPSTW